MDLLLLLKKNDEVLGYQGKGDFSLEEKNKKVSKFFILMYPTSLIPS